MRRVFFGNLLTGNLCSGWRWFGGRWSWGGRHILEEAGGIALPMLPLLVICNKK